MVFVWACFQTCLGEWGTNRAQLLNCLLRMCLPLLEMTTLLSSHGRLSVASHSHQHSVMSVGWIWDILIDVSWHLVAVLVTPLYRKVIKSSPPSHLPLHWWHICSDLFNFQICLLLSFNCGLCILAMVL